MKRAILAGFTGIVVWVLVVSLLDRGLRVAIDGYAAAEPKFTFTLGMMVGRLTIAALTSLVAGAAAGLIARTSKRVPWIIGVILLVSFIPSHVALWSRFPIWYHLTFLGTLVPLVVLGSRLARGGAAAKQVTVAIAPRSS